jgi:hypothetical protein
MLVSSSKKKGSSYLIGVPYFKGGSQCKEGLLSFNSLFGSID